MYDEIKNSKLFFMGLWPVIASNLQQEKGSLWLFVCSDRNTLGNRYCSIFQAKLRSTDSQAGKLWPSKTELKIRFFDVYVSPDGNRDLCTT